MCDINYYVKTMINFFCCIFYVDEKSMNSIVIYLIIPGKFVENKIIHQTAMVDSAPKKSLRLRLGWNEDQQYF